MASRIFRKRQTPSTSSASEESHLGIKVLKEPEIALDAIVDIVFVHGLRGGQEETWTAKGEKASWPELLLPNDIPEARIAAYGYDANVIKLSPAVGLSRIGDLGENLIAALTHWRARTKTNDRPIIFVAHSLGGLLCEDALLASRDSIEESRQRILRCTYAIAFIGTPHCGSDLARWATISGNFVSLLKQVNVKLLTLLEPSSEVLARIQKGFHSMLLSSLFNSERKLKITCFYEELGMAGIGMIVPLHSAILPGYTSTGIHADHIDMAKFSGMEDPGYLSISGEIRIWVDNIRSRLESTFGDSEHLRNVQLVSDLNIPLELPYSPNTKFVGRKSEIDRLRGHLSQDDLDAPCVVLLVGIGGIGKSQIALRYAYRYMNEYSAIFWIDARTQESLQLSFLGATQRVATHFSKRYTEADIAKCFGLTDLSEIMTKIPENPRVQQRIIREILQWLAERQNSNWLLIFDNYDDIESFDIASYFPRTITAQILLTSQRQDCQRLCSHTIQVQELEPEAAVALLLQDNEIEIEDGKPISDTAKKIAREMFYFPLAIDQAKSYINARKITLETFLAQYEKRFKRVMESKPRISSRYERTVFTTLDICHTAIAQENAAASELLFLCSFFGDSVWDDFLRRAEPGLEDDILLEDSIACLISYSLMKRRDKEACLWIHPVVRAWARESLSAYGKSRMASRALYHVKNVLPSFFDQRRNTMNKRILPNIRTFIDVGLCLVSPSDISSDIFQTLDLLVRMAPFLGSLRLWGIVCLKALDLSRSFPETPSPIIRKAWSNLAVGLCEAGWSVFAEAISEFLLRDPKYNTSLTDLDVAIQTDNLGVSLLGQKRYVEAEKLCRQAISKLKLINPLPESDLAITRSHLALCLLERGMLRDAEITCREAYISMLEASNSSHNPFISRIGQTFASILRKQNKAAEAESIYQETIQFTLFTTEPDNPLVLKCTTEYAKFLVELKRFSNAENLFKEVADMSEKRLGDQDILTVQAVYNLAATLQYQHRYKEAITLSRQALRGLQVFGGEYGLDILHCQLVLGVSLGMDYRFQEACSILNKALESSERLVGLNHELTIKISSNLRRIRFAERARHMAQ